MNSTAGPPVFVALLFPRYARTEIPPRTCVPPRVPDYSEGNTPVAKAPPGGQLPQQNAPFKPRRAQVDRRVPASLNLSRPAQSLCRWETVLSRTGMLAEAFAQARTTIAVANCLYTMRAKRPRLRLDSRSSEQLREEVLRRAERPLAGSTIRTIDLR